MPAPPQQEITFNIRVTGRRVRYKCTGSIEMIWLADANGVMIGSYINPVGSMKLDPGTYSLKGLTYNSSQRSSQPFTVRA